MVTEEIRIRRQKILIYILACAVILLLGAVVILFLRERTEENITIGQPSAQTAPTTTSAPPQAVPAPSSSAPVSPKPALKSAYFTYPYPLTWTENADEFALTGVTLGEIDAMPDMINGSTGQPYPNGAKVYALTLVLKISTGDSQMCLPVNMRRVINEAGDLAQPNTAAYGFLDVRGGNIQDQLRCPAPNSVFDNQKVVFVVPQTDTQFTFTTGGSSNIFFFVSVQNDGTLKVEKAPTSENG